jgi:microcystin-dependent protein
MRKTSILPGSTTTENSDFPFGKIIDGATPVIEATYSDFIQNLWRFISLSGITPNGLQDNTSNGFQLSKALQVVLDPIGSTKEWPSESNLPAGYVKEDGRSLVKADYIDLWNLIGYYYGGSGANFNIPDSRNKFIVGSGSGYSIASTGGEANHVLSKYELPAHTHQVQHLVSGGSGNQGASGQTATTFQTLFDGTILTDNGEGLGYGHNNIPPYLAKNRIIKIQYV